MFAIKFDSVLFTDLETLSAYIAGAYGSWSQVPEDHPQIGLVESLAILNTSYYEDRDGVAVYRPRSEWPVLEEDDKESYYDSIDDHDEWPEYDYYCPMVAVCQRWADGVRDLGLGAEVGQHREDVCPDCPHL